MGWARGEGRGTSRRGQPQARATTPLLNVSSAPTSSSVTASLSSSAAGLRSAQQTARHNWRAQLPEWEGRCVAQPLAHHRVAAVCAGGELGEASQRALTSSRQCRLIHVAMSGGESGNACGKQRGCTAVSCKACNPAVARDQPQNGPAAREPARRDQCKFQAGRGRTAGQSPLSRSSQWRRQTASRGRSAAAAELTR